MSVTVGSFELAASVRDHSGYLPLLEKFTLIAERLTAERDASLHEVLVDVCEEMFGGNREAEALLVPLFLRDIHSTSALTASAGQGRSRAASRMSREEPESLCAFGPVQPAVPLQSRRT